MLRRATLIAVCFIATTAGPGRALHRVAPPVTKVTQSGVHRHTRAASGTDALAFSSPHNLLHQGGEGQRLFLFGLNGFTCARTPSYQCHGPEFVFREVAGPNDMPDNGSFDSRLQRTAFDADGTLTGRPIATRQIFVRDFATSALVSVTADLDGAADGDSTDPMIDRAGTRVVFQSTAPLAGTSGGAARLFLADLATGAVVAVGPPDGESRHGRFDTTGKRLVFEWTPAQCGPDRAGVTQIFWADVDPTGAGAVVRQLTAGNGASVGPTFSGTAVLFASAATDLPGTAGGPGTHIFAVDLASTPPLFRQLTTGPGDCTDPVPAGGGAAFVCTGDLLGNRTNGRRVFLIDAQGALGQVTGSGEVVGPIGALGRWLLSLARDRHDGAGPQLEIMNLYHWQVATARGEVPVEVVDDARCRAELCDRAGTCLVTTELGCDDGDPCTVQDPCVNGACSGGEARNCDDGDPCNGAESCDPATGACRSISLVTCDDGDACNGTERCERTTGTCIPGTPLACDDANACTRDACHARVGCVHLSVPGCGTPVPGDPAALLADARAAVLDLPPKVRMRLSPALKRAITWYGRATGTSKPERTVRAMRLTCRWLRELGQRLARADVPPGARARIEAASRSCAPAVLRTG